MLHVGSRFATLNPRQISTPLAADHDMTATQSEPASPLAYLRAALFWLGFNLLAVLYAPFTLVSPLFPFDLRERLMRTFPWLIVQWLQLSCGLKYRVTGLEHLPPRGQGIIVMSKHQSSWETFAFEVLLPAKSWVLKRELLHIPVFGWGLRAMEPIAIDRAAGRAAVKQVVDQGRARLDKGRWVVVFPEGTRVPPGQRVRYKQGGAILAEQSGYPILPVAHNAGSFWRKGQFTKRPGTIDVVFGPVISSEGKKAGEILAEAEAWIEGTMDRITPPTVPEEQRTTPV